MFDEFKKYMEAAEKLTPLLKERKTATEQRRKEIDEIWVHLTSKYSLEPTSEHLFLSIILGGISFSIFTTKDSGYGLMFFSSLIALLPLIFRFCFYQYCYYSAAFSVLIRSVFVYFLLIGVPVWIITALLGHKDGEEFLLFMLGALLLAVLVVFLLKVLAKGVFTVTSKVTKSVAESMGASEKTADTIGKVTGVIATAGIMLEAKSMMRGTLVDSSINSDDVVTSTPQIDVEPNFVDTPHEIFSDNLVFDTGEQYSDVNTFENIPDINPAATFAGPLFGNGFEINSVDGIGSFYDNQVLDFSGITVDTTIDIPEIKENPYMLFASDNGQANFVITDANGMPQLSIRDNTVYNSTNAYIGHIEHNDVTGVRSLTDNTNRTILSMDKQSNIYAGTPETGKLVGHVATSGAVDTYFNLNGSIGFYRDHLGNFWAEGKPLGRIDKI